MYYRELAVGFVSVVFWLSLYLFERSWIKTFGLTLTLTIYLGTVVWLLDRHFRVAAAKLSANRRLAAPRGRSTRYLQRGGVNGGASPSRF
jgi:hypothetical protein